MKRRNFIGLFTAMIAAPVVKLFPKPKPTADDLLITLPMAYEYESYEAMAIQQRLDLAITFSKTKQGKTSFKGFASDLKWGG